MSFLKDIAEKNTNKIEQKPVPTISTQAKWKYKVYFRGKNQIRP